MLTAMDRPTKLAAFQRLYLDPGTPGLQALTAARGYTLEQYVDAIDRYPAFWASIRPLTARANEAASPLARDLAAFQRLYPELKPASITYAVGVLRTGGTTQGDMVLVGAEIALADETVDVSELPEPMRTRLGAYPRPARFHQHGHEPVPRGELRLAAQPDAAGSLRRTGGYRRRRELPGESCSATSDGNHHQRRWRLARLSRRHPGLSSIRFTATWKRTAEVRKAP
jgi:hypothetical protein